MAASLSDRIDGLINVRIIEIVPIETAHCMCSMHTIWTSTTLALSCDLRCPFTHSAHLLLLILTTVFAPVTLAYGRDVQYYPQMASVGAGFQLI